MSTRSAAGIGLCVALGWAMIPAVSSSVAADNGSPPAADAAAGAGTGQPPAGEGGESGLHWFLRCSGVIGLFIFGLSVYFVAVVIRLFLHMRTEVAVPPDVSGGFRNLLAQGNFQSAYELARASDSYLGRVLAKGIEQLPNGLAEARHAMERIGESETVRMEKQISIMAVLGTLGPMIGLIGTLKGMISSFSVIAMQGVTLKASEVAGGISEALLLTFEGVSLSVPAIYFFAVFRNRVALITMDAMVEADDLLNLFFRSGRAKGTATATQRATTHP
jgi:biopolymer transport protein ExbB